MRYPVVVSALTVLLVFALMGYADECLPYGQPVTIQGRLGTNDDGGYRQWIALRPMRTLCIMDDRSVPIAELQASPLGNADVLDHLGRLLGYAVVVRGTLYPAITIGIAAVEPIDDAGRAALARPQPKVPIKEVAAYHIEIVAGKHLIKEVRQTATGRFLKPFEAYAPHTMSGDDLMYPRCREGYRLESGIIYPPPVDRCRLDVCGVEIGDRTHTVTIDMRCVRATTTVLGK